MEMNVQGKLLCNSNLNSGEKPDMIVQGKPVCNPSRCCQEDCAGSRTQSLCINLMSITQKCLTYALINSIFPHGRYFQILANLDQ